MLNQSAKIRPQIYKHGGVKPARKSNTRGRPEGVGEWWGAGPVQWGWGIAEVKKVNEAHGALAWACVVLRGRNFTDREPFSLIK